MACRAPITINTSVGPILTSCKQCLSCRIARQSALTLRCILEDRTTSSGVFITLTYADAPEKGEWNDFSKFLKRLRAWNHRADNPLPISYLGCGEYGTKSKRFHYHGLIFNSLPIQPDLHERLWPHGFAYTGTVTPASIRYTARYCLKFNHPDYPAISNWSKGRPASGRSPSREGLGENGMRQLARAMIERGQKPDEVPAFLKIENRSYPLDRYMRQVFVAECAVNGHAIEPKHAREAHEQWLMARKFGDPIEQQRQAWETRNEFYESARFSNEKI